MGWNEIKTNRFSFAFFVLLGLAGAVYLCLTIAHMLSTSTPLASITARMTIVIPEIAIWFVAAFGAIRFKRYAASIRSNADGRSLNIIANAMLMLVLYIVTLATRNAVVMPFVHSPILLQVIFLRNHMPVVILLAAALLLYRGTSRLVRLAPDATWSIPLIIVFVVACCICFTGYSIFFVIHEPHAGPIAGVPRFALPIRILFFTYVLPQLVTWMLGGLACINLAHYSSNVPGKIYKVLFHDLYIGMLVILAGVFIGQFGVISRFAGVQQFSPRIILVYALLCLIGAGFIHLWNGTKTLDRIETS